MDIELQPHANGLAIQHNPAFLIKADLHPASGFLISRGLDHAARDYRHNFVTAHCCTVEHSAEPMDSDDWHEVELEGDSSMDFVPASSSSSVGNQPWGLKCMHFEQWKMEWGDAPGEAAGLGGGLRAIPKAPTERPVLDACRLPTALQATACHPQGDHSGYLLRK